jgi:anti-sigma B factor antagonist
MAGAEPGERDIDRAEAPFTVEHAIIDGRDRITVAGELDAFTASDLRTALAGTDGTAVELDLGGVSFIDSSGLAMVVESHQRLEADARRLVIVERSAIVQRLLDLSGLTSRLDLDPTAP